MFPQIGVEGRPLGFKKEVSPVSSQTRQKSTTIGNKTFYDKSSQAVHPGGGQRLPAQTELLVLWAISNTGDNGIYGLDIQRAIADCSGGNESISVGTLYSSLKRLRSRGFVTSVEGDPIAGGAKRQYYHLTESGRAVVNYSNNFISRLSAWIPGRG
jgi:DNA-binding PadR family transcriptional regulator